MPRLIPQPSPQYNEKTSTTTEQTDKGTQALGNLGTTASTTDTESTDNQPEQPAATGLGEDQNQAQAVPCGPEANLCNFDTASGHSQPNLSILDLGEDDSGSAYFDPGVRALEQHAQQQTEENADLMEANGINNRERNLSEAEMDVALLQAEMDFKLTKELLDGLQRSLDRAKEMLEQNMRDYYKKVLPQLQAMEKQLNLAQAQLEAGQQTQARSHLDQLGKLAQELQQSLAANPDTQDNPAAAKIQAALSVLAHASARIAN